MFTVFCNTANPKLNMPSEKDLTCSSSAGILKPGFRSEATEANSSVPLNPLIRVILWGPVPRE